MSRKKTAPAAGARVLIGVLAVAILAVLASLNSYQGSADERRQARDRYGVESALLRLAAASRRLPPAGAVGYLSDLQLSDQAGTPAFLAAQYVLAPHLLVPVDAHASTEWAVGNFSRPVDFAAVGARAGYTMVTDMGNGVVLYRKATP
ncbi:MAG: hypothetical protein LAP87_22745 [Acidobacteriia bacterium]|nr:hypothetical protein [Terriglobia bacterium]